MTDTKIDYVEHGIVDAKPELRKAAAEALLSGALLIAEVRRHNANGGYLPVGECEARFTKALEMMKDALS